MAPSSTVHAVAVPLTAVPLTVAEKLWKDWKAPGASVTRAGSMASDSTWNGRTWTGTVTLLLGSATLVATT